MFAATGGTGSVADFINRFTGPWLYIVAGVLTFAETGTLFFLIPGEIALLVTGAAAGAGDLNLWILLAVACGSAVFGDFVGFHIGDRFGPRLEQSWLGRKFGESNWTKAKALVRRRRGPVIIIGRWIGFLRAIMPATVGMSEMTYRQFLPWDLVGALSWASLCTIGGYKLGNNWERLARDIGLVGIILGIGIVLVIGLWFVKRRFTRPPDQATPA